LDDNCLLFKDDDAENIAIVDDSDNETEAFISEYLAEEPEEAKYSDETFAEPEASNAAVETDVVEVTKIDPIEALLADSGDPIEYNVAAATDTAEADTQTTQTTIQTYDGAPNGNATKQATSTVQYDETLISIVKTLLQETTTKKEPEIAQTQPTIVNITYVMEKKKVTTMVTGTTWTTKTIM